MSFVVWKVPVSLSAFNRVILSNSAVDVRACVCACVCACMRACVRACVCECLGSVPDYYVCMFSERRDS